MTTRWEGVTVVPLASLHNKNLPPERVGSCADMSYYAVVHPSVEHDIRVMVARDDWRFRYREACMRAKGTWTKGGFSQTGIIEGMRYVSDAEIAYLAQGDHG